MSTTVRVHFEPDGKSIFVLKGTTLIEAAGKAGIILETPCGGNGSCGKCKVQVTKGQIECSDACHKRLSDQERGEGYRLACQTHVTQDAVIHVPAETRFFEQKILVEGAERQTALEPNIRKRYAQLAAPTLEDQRSDLDRLRDALDGEIPQVRSDIDVIRQLPDKLRDADFAVTAVLEGDEIITIEPGDTTSCNYGVAFDVGTTTLVGMLIDLNTGKQLATASRTNPQVVYGDDVISRISYTHEKPEGLKELQERVVGGLNEMIAEVCQSAGVDRNCIYEATVVGNTTMNHILLNISPWHIAQSPYVASVRRAVEVKARRLGLHINETGNLYAMPNIAGFVGGDTVGVILAANLMESDTVKLAIDIGTNGEIAFGSKERMVACSCAAGPAFEGARIQHGMRAADGAIDKVVMEDGDVAVSVIGNVPARGLCGTGLIDAVAELLRVGIVDSMGRVVSGDKLPNDLSDQLRVRVVPGERSGSDFVLVLPEHSQNGQALRLTQRDIREVQLAKGAIFAGIQVLKSVLGVDNDDISEVLLAGAFGNFIRRSMAKRIGLLPDVPLDRIRFVGNAAGVGAKMALVAKKCRDEAERISRETEYIELGGRADFQQEFMMAMTFPEG